ncbi:hypothetical protein HN51_036470 [Arachis hypogaea]|uniref:Uncharacterized protein n=1 Tax=Arachis hypogaea TaxID=3818 RepID=A0A444ZZV3_ARAHY|nr:DNA-directed RNA polymerases II, IV and V subunit 12-like [Arachis ipaensis]XP_025636888.1 DNA-directed RNA polymerases II, IV and V subunit 12 [Arachis hypogaea]QHO01837.1 DNA-directed RNA polymerases II, IV and V subunit [Arachis hypogaea]RYR19706.1 hypothetical protein Ahy_B03g064574 [Arachis hypogaea]
MDPQVEPVSYFCGDCGMENKLKPGDVIQCYECGYHMLYKKRTRRIVQYEARRKNQAKLDSVLACSFVSYFRTC